MVRKQKPKSKGRYMSKAERQEWISKKIRLLRREGKSARQAIGAAYGMWRSGWAKKHPL